MRKPIPAAVPRLILGQPFAGTDFLGTTFPTPADLKLRAMARARPKPAAPPARSRRSKKK
jgi:hypothetical protein